MTMKRTELDKRQGLAIRNALKQTGARYDTAASPGERRAQRERDRAAGLIPFAVKLPAALVGQLQQRAAAQGVTLAALTEALLTQAIEKEDPEP
jgi:hypothetical protein